jgi:hypothetical protein
LDYPSTSSHEQELLTFSCDAAYRDALFVGHETEVGEDDETGEEAGKTVDSSSHEAVPVRTGTKVLRYAWISVTL